MRTPITVTGHTGNCQDLGKQTATIKLCVVTLQIFVEPSFGGDP